MNTHYHFRIADLLLTLELPPTINAHVLLPSFEPFACSSPPPGTPTAFICRGAAQAPDSEPIKVFETAVNGTWHTLVGENRSHRPIIEVACNNHPAHRLELAPDFRSATLFLQPADPCAGEALSTLLRIAFSQVLLLHEGVSLHASAVVFNNKGYLFTGRSGTGKSTHASLWTNTFKGCSLLNDDNPALRLQDHNFKVYGTPWSGKTPCYRNLSAPVAGIVRLRQASHNIYTPCHDIEAFTTLLSSSALVTRQSGLSDSLYTLLIQLASAVPVGILDCQPTCEAAHCCACALQATQPSLQSTDLQLQSHNLKK